MVQIVSCERLVRALCVETHEAWLEASRYLNTSLLAEQKKERLKARLLEAHLFIGRSNHLDARRHNKIKARLRDAGVNLQLTEFDDSAVAVGVVNRA